MTSAISIKQAEVRAAKRKRGECRVCSHPAFVKRNGKVLLMCRVHLDKDAERKKKP